MEWRENGREEVSRLKEKMKWSGGDGKRLVAQVSQTRRFANRSGFNAPIGVVLAWEERGSCLNIFRTTNRGRISKIFLNYEAKDLLRKNLHELRGKRLVAQVSQTRRFALYSRTGVGLMLRLESFWHGGAGSCLNIFRMTNHGRISEPSRITRQKTCCASESNTSVRVVFANRSGFDAPIEVSWHGRSVDHVLTYSGPQMRPDLRNLHELRGKKLVASESTFGCVVIATEWF
ncbi:uncharacterized protein G2W53_010011 [Senna tora]|uniref:Uncharacterized protein n=1 Tax=Senna tora TaxID=362788 RepID=A0A834X054_9FABA|nr:uncharacterized protein G2W53_010011 [Senna tora]